MTDTKKKFSWRAFISLGLTYSFIIIFITGIVLYLAPPGRIAHWVNWKFMGFLKEEWQAIHMNFSLLFVILSIFHLFTINWKTFWSYLKSKTSKGLNKKREFIISTFLTIAIFFAIIFSVPPFSNIVDFGEYLTNSWENKEETPPIPHAELFTLADLPSQLENMSIESIESKLNAHKIKYESVNQTLSEIAHSNNITPNALYDLIVKKPQGGMQGMGLGKKTLEDLANENAMDVKSFIDILKANNIEANKDETLKDLADKYNMAARDLYSLIMDNH